MPTKAFAFSKGKKSKRLPKPKNVPKLTDPQEQPPFFIRGIKAQSKEEYWVSLALEKIEKQHGWGWDYQVPIYGGRRRRGGNVVDFLLYTPGRWTIIEPKGRYWHTGKHEDQAEMQNLAREKNWNLIEWFTDETPTKESVLSLLRRRLSI